MDLLDGRIQPTTRRRIEATRASANGQTSVGMQPTSDSLTMLWNLLAVMVSILPLSCVFLHIELVLHFLRLL